MKHQLKMKIFHQQFFLDLVELESQGVVSLPRRMLLVAIIIKYEKKTGCR